MIDVMKKFTFKKPSSQVVMRYLAALAAVSYFLAAVTTLLGGVLPVKYTLVMFVGGAVGVYLLVRAMIKKSSSRLRRALLASASVVLIVISLAIVSANWTLMSFIRDIQPSGYTTETYSIIAKKDRHIKLKTAKSSGLIGSDQHLEKVKAGLATKTAATPRLQGNTTALMQSLESNKTDTATLSSAYMKLVEDNYSQYYANIEVLATFTIRIENDASLAGVDVSQPFTMYISGIDTYGDISSVARSDVNMLAVVNPTNHQMLLVNTPRDYYLQLHGTTGQRDKLTHAGIYGIDKSRQTLEDLYDTKIDYYARVNFSSLEKLVDTLGGVMVHSEQSFKSFQRGANQLDGRRALEFSRERYSFEEGDRQRGKNQQLVIEAIISKLSEPSSALKYQSVINALQGSLQTNMGPAAIKQLANQQLNDMGKWQVESISVDGTGKMASTYSMGALPLYVMEPDQQTVDDAKSSIRQYLKQ